MSRLAILGAGIALVLALTWSWHGPMDAGERLAIRAEQEARAMLDHYEMVHVQAHMERGPLTRRMILSGPADDFQRSEIRRLAEELPGVGEARWSAASLESEPVR